MTRNLAVVAGLIASAGVVAGAVVVASSDAAPVSDLRYVISEPGDTYDSIAVEHCPQLTGAELSSMNGGDVLDVTIVLLPPACDATVVTTTTTTVPVTTTTVSPTTSSSTTTTTEPPPDGDTFVESFDTAASLDDWVFTVSDFVPWPGSSRSWEGDHAVFPDGSCSPPTDTRTLTSPDTSYGLQVHDNDVVRANGWVYWCELGNQHVMTSYDSGGYAHFDFRPNRTFVDVSTVCWDQNVTAMGGGKWTEVAVVPIDTFNANGGRMDYTFPDRNGPGQPGSWGLPITDDVLKANSTQLRVAMDQTIELGVNSTEQTEDKAFRGQHCLVDNGDGTVTFSREQPTAGVQSATMPGVFPAGESVVIFSDVLYNPTKRPGNDDPENTWHWDNIEIGG